MKTWKEFNDAVNELLLVDGARKGRGVERFRDRLIVNGVRDLQKYIPALRLSNLSQSYTSSDLTVHSEGQAEQGDFNFAGARFKDIIVRRMPTDDNGLDRSVYYKPKVYSSLARFSILDGGNSPRSATYPGKIFFEEGTFYSAPLLIPEETLTIYFTAEKAYKPYFETTRDEQYEVTKLGDDEALAVSHYVKYHIHRDMNDDQVGAKTNEQLYQRARRELYAHYRDIVDSTSTTTNTQTLTDEGFLIGDG